MMTSLRHITLAASILTFATLPVAAAAIAHDADRNITVVATAGELRAFDAGGLQRWSAQCVANPTTVVIDGGRGALLDPLADRITLFDVTRGTTQTITVEGGPAEALFVDEVLFVVARDSGEVVRIAGREQRRVTVGRDPAFLRHSRDRLLVYSRVDGTVSLLDADLRPDKRLQLAPFASDLETDGTFGYVVYPRNATIVSFSIDTLDRAEQFTVGAVPVDLAVIGKRTALTAAQLAIADPSTKKIWREEGSQSSLEAFGRGLLRGAIGLGLYKPKSPDFPTGIDRLYVAGRELLAYDTASRSLFLVRGSKVRKLLSDVAASEIAVTSSGVTWWEERTQRLRRIRLDS